MSVWLVKRSGKFDVLVGKYDFFRGHDFDTTETLWVGADGERNEPTTDQALYPKEVIPILFGFFDPLTPERLHKVLS